MASSARSKTSGATSKSNGLGPNGPCGRNVYAPVVTKRRLGYLRAEELSEPRCIVPPQARKRSADHEIGLDIVLACPHALVHWNSKPANEFRCCFGRRFGQIDIIHI